MKYGEQQIKNSKLESWPNKNKKRDYLIEITLPEFTCLCPRSGYPDFATIFVKYIPDQKVVELKSIKLFINKFRNVHISHEDAANEILDSLVKLLNPRWIEVKAEFTPRGNVKTTVTVHHKKKGYEFPFMKISQKLKFKRQN